MAALTFTPAKGAPTCPRGYSPDVQGGERSTNAWWGTSPPHASESAPENGGTVRGNVMGYRPPCDPSACCWQTPSMCQPQSMVWYPAN